MSTPTNIARQVVHDKIESQVKTVQAKLDTLKARAESTKANAEIKAIADLAPKAAAIGLKLVDLKRSGEATYDQARTDIESRIAELEGSVRTIEAKLKA